MLIQTLQGMDRHISHKQDKITHHAKREQPIDLLRLLQQSIFSSEIFLLTNLIIHTPLVERIEVAPITQPMKEIHDFTFRVPVITR